jgi:hypothetical protein
MKSRIPDNMFFGTANDQWIAESYNYRIKEGKYDFDVNLFKIQVTKQSKSFVVTPEEHEEFKQSVLMAKSNNQSVMLNNPDDIEDLSKAIYS